MAKAQSNAEILTEKLKLKLKNEHCKDDGQGDGTDDRCNDTYEARLFYGTHEIQEAEGGETELHKYLDSCTKNPGHTQFVPVSDFNTSHLPQGHQDEGIVELIKATADLTVRVAVKMTSTERPEFWPNTNQPYPYYDKRGSGVMRLGTGIIKQVYKYIEEYNMVTCLCHKCQNSDTPSKVCGHVRMRTATQVVFDDLEARHTTCILFYDGQDSPLVTLDGWTVGITKIKIKEDMCELLCVICDVDLLNKLYKMRSHCSYLREKVTNKYKNSREQDKLTFIVSHPHGCPKQISVGQWMDRYVVDKDGNTRFTYTACTCPGSGGAYVHSLGFDDEYLHFRHVHCGVNSEGNNFCNPARDWPVY